MTDLHPEMERILGTLDRMDVPAFHTLPWEEARALGDRLIEMGSAERTPVGEVREFTVGGPDGPVPVRLYLPEGGGPVPTLVYCHGGGFIAGSLDTADETCRRFCAAAGVGVVSVGYRLAPEHPFPAAPKDCYAALEWVASNPARVEGDGRLAVGGHSSGGTLAAAAALLADEFDGPDLAYALLAYPPAEAGTDRPSFSENAEGYFISTADVAYFHDLYLADDLHGYNRFAFPLEAPDLSGMPPTTVVTCGFDPLRDGGDALADRLDDAGVDVTHRRYPDLVHGVVTMVGNESLDRPQAVLSDLVSDLRAAFD